MPERVYLTVGEVLQIHHQLINNYGGVHGIRDTTLLESAVFRPQIGYYNSIAEEAAALMESLANNHLFLDGNKRAAFAAAHTFSSLVFSSQLPVRKAPARNPGRLPFWA